MEGKRKLIIILLILLHVMLIKCEDNDSENCEFALCTEEFRGVALIIKNKDDGTGYVLSKFTVKVLPENKDITIESSDLMKKEGFYFITNDNQLETFKNKSLDVEFKGYVDDSLVIQKQFTIKGDCCHIYLVKGETLVYL